MITPISKLAVQDRLQRHFRRLSTDILRDYGDGIQSGTPEAVANFREDFIREIVGRVYERTFRLSKGPIFDSLGGRSKSIDCVVCAPNHPLFLDPIGRDCALLADGVHSAIEIKPNITALPKSYEAELVRGLEQLRSCKRLQRTEPGVTKAAFQGHPVALQDWLLRVPAHLFSLESRDLKETAEYIAGYYREQQVQLWEQFDFLVVLGVGMLEVVKYPKGSITSPVIAIRHLGEDALGNFLFRTSTLPGPELRLSEPLMQRYLGGVFDDHRVATVPTFGSFNDFPPRPKNL
jgi:hypothetical protein